MDQPRFEGRFDGHYSALELRAAMRDVLEYASPDDPLRCTQRDFDQKRAGAGHPTMPTARQCCVRLGRPGEPRRWEELRAELFELDRSDLMTETQRGASDENPHLTSQHVCFAFGLVAMELGVHTFTPGEYEVCRLRIAASDRADGLNGPALEDLMPTVGQIYSIALREADVGQNAAWDWALTVSHLEPREIRKPEKMGMTPARAIYWFVKCCGVHRPRRTQVKEFARVVGFSMSDTRSKGSRRKVWVGHMADAEEQLAAEGITLPNYFPPSDMEFEITLPEGGIPEAAPRQKPSIWTHERCLYAVRQFLAARATTAKRGRREYVAWQAGHPDRPSATTLDQYGGFDALREEAERLNRAARIGEPPAEAESADDAREAGAPVDASASGEPDAGDTEEADETDDEAGAGDEEASDTRMVVRVQPTLRRKAPTRKNTPNRLIDLGLLTAGERLVHLYKGRLIEATLTDDGRVLLPGSDTPRSLSQAVVDATDLKTANGWSFWRVVRDQREVKLSEIRDQAADGEAA